MSISKIMQMAAAADRDPFPTDQAMIFNGSSSYIYNFSAGTGFGTSDFTLEASIRPDATSGYRMILGQNYSASGGALYIYDGQLNYYQGGSIVTAGTINTNTWYHVAASRAGNTLRLFIDGVEVGSASISENTTDNDLLIGRGSSTENAVPSTEEFDGEIYRPRWSDFARYISDFTPSETYGVDSNTVALVIFDGSVASEEAQGLSLTVNNLNAGSKP